MVAKVNYFTNFINCQQNESYSDSLLRMCQSLQERFNEKSNYIVMVIVMVWCITNNNQK